MTFALMAVCFVIGLLAARFGSVSRAVPERINALIINLALPAMILLKVPALVLDKNALVPVASAWLVILGTAFIIWIFGKLYDWPARTLGALLLVVPLSNTAYLGLPLLNALTNDTVVAYGALYDQFGTFLGLSVYAPVIVALLGGAAQGQANSESIFGVVPTILKRLFSFVPFPVLLIAATLMTADTLPAWTEQPLNLLSLTMGPLAAFIVGFSLRFTVPATLRMPLYVGVGVRLLIAPALVLLATRFFSVAEPAATASVLQAAMPSMITAGLVGIAAGFSERLIIAMLSVSTVLSLVTLGTLFWSLG